MLPVMWNITEPLKPYLHSHMKPGQYPVWEQNALTASTVRGNLVINSSVLNTSATVVSHSIAGDIIMNGGSITGTAATYVLNGTSAQSLTMMGSIPSLTVNKASGSVSLNSDLTINNTPDLYQRQHRYRSQPGDPRVGFFRFRCSQSTGWVEGYMKRHVASGTSVSRSFAVGSASYYAPVSVQFATVSSVRLCWKASTYDNDHSELDYSGIDDAKSVNRYWLLEQSVCWIHFGQCHVQLGNIQHGRRF